MAGDQVDEKLEARTDSATESKTITGGDVGAMAPGAEKNLFMPNAPQSAEDRKFAALDQEVGLLHKSRSEGGPGMNAEQIAKLMEGKYESVGRKMSQDEINRIYKDCGEAPPGSAPADKTAGKPVETAKAGADTGKAEAAPKGVDKEFDDWVKRQHEDKDHPKSAHDILDDTHKRGVELNKDQVNEIYKVCNEQQFQKTDELVDAARKQGMRTEQVLQKYANEHPGDLNKAQVDRIYHDMGQKPPELPAGFVTNTDIQGVDGKVPLSVDDLKNYAQMNSAEKAYEQAQRGGSLEAQARALRQLEETTNKFYDGVTADCPDKKQQDQLRYEYQQRRQELGQQDEELYQKTSGAPGYRQK